MKKGNKPSRPRGGAFKRSHTPPRRFEVTEEGELLPFLLNKLAPQGRNTVKSMLAHGQVSVDDRTEKLYNHPLRPGQIVSVSKERSSAVPQLVGLRILHEDDAVIVVHKDAGLLSIATERETELTAYRQLTAHVRLADPRARIFVLHRLDRETSGVMMFAKSEQVQKKMQDNWKDIVKERTYVALVEGLVKKASGTISSWLKETSTLKMYSSPVPNDGQHAITHYKVLRASRNYSLLGIELETGRKNQIRVHMQDLGHPIAGDKKYGSKTKPFNRLGLHARVLAFEHPTTGKQLRFETDIPKPFLSQFKDEAQ
ncbi:RluA family pseudouridine synthase [Cohnella terricola]|uniref:Pseudouridine synthase n=1 Tax=Cohnella terricola TaxID=1289167 RepID=A0A559JN23_9BACL|nr:RluA family pseudouridine synthase [Cohnella terricola]TVY01270.1 RluA family pseudouridine synthase [Cohnella terricola]